LAFEENDEKKEFVALFSFINRKQLRNNALIMEKTYYSSMDAWVFSFNIALFSFFK
jgi:hypothetical protein